MSLLTSNFKFPPSLLRSYGGASQTSNTGFTLLEMIVSLGIFAVVAVIAVGALVKITGLNRQAQSLQSAMNNVNFALEAISREMRFGTSYHCDNSGVYNSNGTLSTNPCDATGLPFKGILFKSSKTDAGGCNLVYAYWFVRIANNPDRWSLRKSQQSACSDSISDNTASSIIDETNVTITGVNYSVTQPVGGRNYSWATIRLIGYAGIKENEKNYFDVRTGVSQRLPD